MEALAKIRGAMDRLQVSNTDLSGSGSFNVNLVAAVFDNIRLADSKLNDVNLSG